MPSLRNLTCPVQALSSGSDSHFFGYYDKSPWRGEMVLAHKSSLTGRLPVTGERVDIGLLSEEKRFEAISQSSAWNFQQGSMLQWMPGSADEIAYNDIVNGSPVGVRLNICNGSRVTYDRPFAAISSASRQALSINFGRLTLLKPEYGYAGLVDTFANDPCPSEDGIWLVDMDSGRSSLLLSVREIAAVGVESVAAGHHYVNHVMYSQGGRRFCFLHRYVNAAGTQNTRLLVCNADGSDLKVLMTGMASHFGWRGDRQLLAWASPRKLLQQATGRGLISRLPVGAVLRRAYRLFGKPAAFKSAVMKDRYLIFDVEDGTMRTVGKGALNSDGHCSFSPDGEWFVTDTYPDKTGKASVFLGNIERDEFIKVAEFVMPPELDGEIRCDLHPRWHSSLPYICVDAADSNGRQMFRIDVSSVVEISNVQ